MATVAAALMAKARREVENLFFEHNAFSPDRAVEFEPRLPVQRRFLEQLIAEGIVHESSPGRYWLDLAAYRELRRKRNVATFWILAFAAVIFVVVSAVRYFR